MVMFDRLVQCFQNLIHLWRRRNSSGRSGEEELLPWMKKAIMEFILASVAGLIANGALKDNPVPIQFPSYAILFSFSAFFTSNLFQYFGLAEIARLSDSAGVLSGSVAFSWVLSCVLKGKLRWLAFLSCIFPSVLFVSELFQVLVTLEFVHNLPVSENRGEQTSSQEEIQSQHSTFFNAPSQLVQLVHSFLNKIGARVIDAVNGHSHRTTPAAVGNAEAEQLADMV